MQTNLWLMIISIIFIISTHSMQAGSFGQRYGANSYITTQPLYFKEIDKQGRIIRPDNDFITEPSAHATTAKQNLARIQQNNYYMRDKKRRNNLNS